MRQKRRVKLYKKTKVILLLLLIMFIGSLSFFGKNYYDNTLKNIKKSYHKNIVTKKNTNLYNKNHKKIGSISKDFTLVLSNVKIKSLKNRYFQIKDTNYYIYYKDIKSSKINNKKIDTNYIVFNKNIKTSKKTDLYSGKSKVLTLNKGINTPIIYMDKNYYYVNYLNRVLAIKKTKNIKLIDKNNTKEEEAKHLSVLSYDKIDSNCTDYNCIDINTFKEQINKLKSLEYHFIKIDEYEKYINNYIRLKPKAILLTTNTKDEIVKKLENELDINLEKANIKSDKNHKLIRYDIKSYTTIDNLVKMANGEDVKETPPVKSSDQKIAVLNYHFFYDPTKGESCNETICLDIRKFREHLDYLRKNNYKVLTMKEFKDWMYGRIELPEKSVLITIDDGAMGTGKHNGNLLIPTLEEYKMPATLFLIAGWWDINNYKSEYLTIQSHTYAMHQYGSCGRGQLNCATKEEAKADLQKSLDIIGNNDSFCFPFYYYSDTSLQALKELDFKLAFVGGLKKATRENNKLLIPRYPILSDITMQQFINMVN